MKGNKKGVRNHITLLRAPTLAAFLPWGNSEGASCMTLTDCKNTAILQKCKILDRFLRVCLEATFRFVWVGLWTMCFLAFVSFSKSSLFGSDKKLNGSIVGKTIATPLSLMDNEVAKKVLYFF